MINQLAQSIKLYICFIAFLKYCAKSNHYLQLVLIVFSSFKESVLNEYEAAKDLQIHLFELCELKKAISKMSERQVSEIRRYSNPPANVRKVMEATFMVLGESSDAVQVCDQNC